MTKTQKIFLAVAFCALMAAPSMFATSLNASCGTQLFNGADALVVGANPSVCPTGTSQGLNIGTGVGQDTITGIEVWVNADYTGGLTPSNSVQVVFTPSASAGTFATAMVTCTASGAGSSSTFIGGSNCGQFSGNNNSPGTFQDALTGVSAAALQTIAMSGTISINEVASITSGAVTGYSGNAIIEYDYTVNSGGGVPEPTTFVLMGAGLGLIGLLRRKAARH